jgi:hypothetical protein
MESKEELERKIEAAKRSINTFEVGARAGSKHLLLLQRQLEEVLRYEETKKQLGKNEFSILNELELTTLYRNILMDKQNLTLDDFMQGLKVRDKVTGLEGIVTGVTHFLHGSTRYCVQPSAFNGEYQQERWLEADQLVIVEAVDLNSERA